jgi:hypothetical protein
MIISVTKQQVQGASWKKTGCPTLLKNNKERGNQMEFSRCLAGTPFITNIAVYKAGSVLDEGALVCLTVDTGSLQGVAISVATTTAANDNEVGVTQISSSRATASQENYALNSHYFAMPSNGIPANTTASAASAMQFLPVMMNPGALYYALYSETTGATSTGDAKSVGITASVGTSVVLGSSGVDHCGGWLFTSAVNNTAGTAPTFSGSLRYVTTTAASDTYGLATALNISVDGVTLVVSQPQRKLTVISSGGNHLRSHGAGTAGKIAQSLMIHENFISHAQAPHHPLRFRVDNGLDGLTKVRIWSEVALTNSAYVSDVLG